jgi:hypothetical protein
MADLHHTWTDPELFVAANTIEQQWDWPVGEEQHYWGFSVRPFQANSDMQVVRQWTTTDNNLTSVQHFHLTTNSGGLFRFSAIWVVGA